MSQTGANAEFVRNQVEAYLAQQLQSSDPEVVREARQAQEANARHGIGGWWRDGKRIVVAPKRKA